MHQLQSHHHAIISPQGTLANVINVEGQPSLHSKTLLFVDDPISVHCFIKVLSNQLMPGNPNALNDLLRQLPHQNIVIRPIDCIIAYSARVCST